jgi:hypothetical protein
MVLSEGGITKDPEPGQLSASTLDQVIPGFAGCQMALKFAAVSKPASGTEFVGLCCRQTHVLEVQFQ